MALPQTIPVKYTEEEAEYLSVRPVVRQTFRLDELVDMVLSVTGKDAARVQQILRAGTVVFNAYRYWWAGFEAAADELAVVLAAFPDPDPARPFRAEECAAVRFEGGGQGRRLLLELDRAAAARRRLFSTRSFWDALAEMGQEQAPHYEGYSYPRRADMYALEVAPEQVARLAREAERAAPRALRLRLAPLAQAARIVFLCPRGR